MTPEASRSGRRALAGIFAAMREVFDEMRSLALDQREALLDGDAARLEELTSRAVTLATRFGVLDRERVRLERELGEEADKPPAGEARVEAAESLGRMVREGAVSGAVTKRFGELLFSAGAMSVDALIGTTYLPDGSTRAQRGSAGASLCAEG